MGIKLTFFERLLFLIFILAAISVNGQNSVVVYEASCKEKNEKLAKSLRSDSILLSGILQGASGDRVEYPWRNRLRDVGVRQILASVSFRLESNAVTLGPIHGTWATSEYYRFDDEAKNPVNRAFGSSTNLAVFFKMPIYARSLEILERLSIKDGSCGTLSVNLLDDACLPVFDDIPSLDSKCTQSTKLDD